MQVKFRLIRGHCAIGSQARPGQPMFIGRDPVCQLRPDCAAVDLRHCRIVVDEVRAMVQDLDSQSGTYLNGERITSERILFSGDRLTVGDVEFMVLTLAETESSDPVPPPVLVSTGKLAKSVAGDQVSLWLEQADDEARQKSKNDPNARQFQAKLKSTATVPGGRRLPIPSPPKGEPGKLPQAPPLVAATSVEAAQTMLKKLFQNKPHKSGPTAGRD